MSMNEAISEFFTEEEWGEIRSAARGAPPVPPGSDHPVLVQQHPVPARSLASRPPRGPPPRTTLRSVMCRACAGFTSVTLAPCCVTATS